MNIKQTIISLAVVFGLGLLLFIAPEAYAQTTCGEVETAIISCDIDEEDEVSGDVERSGVWVLLEMVITIMTAGVGVLAVGGIVYGAILYTSAGGNSEQVKKAMGIITNVVIGLLAFALMFVISNFLIPGGIFDTAKTSSSSVLASYQSSMVTNGVNTNKTVIKG